MRRIWSLLAQQFLNTGTLTVLIQNLEKKILSQVYMNVLEIVRRKWTQVSLGVFFTFPFSFLVHIFFGENINNIMIIY